MKQVDMFSGTFDNTVTQRREVWQDGRLMRHAARNCCGDLESIWAVLRKPFGHYPDYPHNHTQRAA